MKTSTKTYILWGFFVTMICLVVTCNSGESSEDSIKESEVIKEALEEAVEEKVEEVKVVVEEKIEEVKEVIEEKTEKVIEEKAEELIEEIIPIKLPSLPKIEELPIELPVIAPEDTKEEATE